MAHFLQMWFCLLYMHTCRIAILKKLVGILVEKTASKIVSAMVGEQQKRGSHRPSERKDLNVKGVRYLYKKREVNQAGHVNYLHQRNKTTFLSVSLLCFYVCFELKD